MTPFELSDRLVEDLARAQPTEATSHGITTYDDRWNDFSPEGLAELEALVREYRREFELLPEPDGEWAGHATQVGLEYLQRRVAFFEGEEHWLDLNSVDSPVQDLRQVFDVMEKATPEGWESVITRLETLPAAMAGYIATLDHGRQLGLSAAKRQVIAALSEADSNAGPESFFLSLPQELAASGVGHPELENRLTEAVPSARQAFGDLAAYLKSTYLPSAKDFDPAGRERWERAAFRFLGTHVDPEETYQWGWEQVRELEEDAAKVAAAIDPDRSVPEVMELLKTDRERVATSPAQFAEIMQGRQDRALEDLSGRHFDIPEQIRRVTVHIAPKGGALGAYYVSPSEDFSRAGSIWYSVGDQEVFPLYDEVSTAYHEGFPGHHLQVGYVMYLTEELSRLLRTFAWWSGSGEGWALYAERLMEELGYFEKPDYQLGMLMSHLFRACRVVIDIGSHLGLRIPEGSPVHGGEAWSFDAAVDMLTQVAFLQRAVARSEVTRYLGWPGQAIAYKVGERVILDLREAQRRRLGAEFALKDFHTRVLSAGAVGLDLLRSFVER